MSRIAIMGVLLLASLSAQALELAGIKLPDTVKVDGRVLQLNGGGVRNKLFFKVYAAGLYLPQKQTAAEAIIDGGLERRVVLYMLREVKSKDLYGALREAIEANHSPDVLSAIGAQMKQMEQIFESLEKVKKGDIITLDYLPASGTRINVNGTERGTIAGAGFNRALLRVWLGDKPVQDDLKKGMLGG